MLPATYHIMRRCLAALLFALAALHTSHAETACQVGASHGVSALSDISADTQTVRRTPNDSLPKQLVQSGVRRAHTDSTASPVDTAALRLATDSIGRAAGSPKLPKQRFVPDPGRALWLSLVLPGAGQIYNRKYWKLPFIYGGFLGCAYALMWNQQMYRDYSQAYLDIMDDDPDTKSYMEMLPPRYDITGREEQFQKLFKRKKDYYRRYRDLSAFCFIGVYLLSVVDAYVDAQLSVFDITPDLSMSVEPAVIGNTHTLGTRSSSAYGIGCSLRF